MVNASITSSSVTYTVPSDDHGSSVQYLQLQVTLNFMYNMSTTSQEIVSCAQYWTKTSFTWSCTFMAS